MKFQSKYEITRDEDHNYAVEYDGKTTILPGVTGTLEICGDKKKTDRLMGWAKKVCLLKVAEHIRAFSGKPLTVDEVWIEAVRKSAWKRDKEKLKEAGDIGARTHFAIDASIAGEEPKLDPDIKQSFDNFRAWLDKSGITLIKGDTYVASLELGYGGALDALGVHDGELVLLDWKTSNALYDTSSLQAAAYAMGFEETFDKTISRAVVVRFGKEKNGDVEPREVNLPAAKEAFKAALKLKSAMEDQLWKPT